MTIVMFNMIDLVFQCVEGFVFDFPARPIVAIESDNLKGFTKPLNYNAYGITYTKH